jgi:hypothetical protein
MVERWTPVSPDAIAYQVRVADPPEAPDHK